MAKPVKRQAVIITQNSQVMKIYMRVLPVSFLMILSVFTSLYGQNESAEVDSTFENYMRTAWEDIQESGFSDSLQNIYSEMFFEYYLNNPSTKTGEKAFAQAFLMWGNTGNSDHVSKALSTLNYNSELWRMIINPLGNIFHRNDDLEAQAYNELLKYLSTRLTEPKSKSAVLLTQLRINSRKDEPNETSIEIARQLVELDANEFYVNQGLGFLHELESLNIGQKAPDFHAHTIDGQKLSLTDLEGQYVLLEFWATWCGPCIPEIPHLKSLHENYGRDNLKIVGISLDRDEETLIDFIQDREITWVQIFEEDGWQGELTRLFNVSGIPRMYLLDPEGIIVGRDLRGEEMVSKVEDLMDEQQNY